MKTIIIFTWWSPFLVQITNIKNPLNYSNWYVTLYIIYLNIWGALSRDFFLIINPWPTDLEWTNNPGKIFIHKLAHHIMNFKVPPESSLIKKYVCRSPDSATKAPTSSATMRDTTLQSIWIENGRNITQNNGLQVNKLSHYHVLNLLLVSLETNSLLDPSPFLFLFSCSPYFCTFIFHVIFYKGT